MDLAIPPEFKRFAHRQIAAGIFSSEEEAVAAVLRAYVDQVAEIDALLEPAAAAIDRGEGVDGEAAMQTLLTRARKRLRDQV